MNNDELIYSRIDTRNTTSMFEILKEVFQHIHFRENETICEESLKPLLWKIRYLVLRDLKRYSQVGDPLIYDPEIFDHIDRFDFYPIQNIIRDCAYSGEYGDIFQWCESCDISSNDFINFINQFDELNFYEEITTDTVAWCQSHPCNKFSQEYKEIYKTRPKGTMHSESPSIVIMFRSFAGSYAKEVYKLCSDFNNDEESCESCL